MWRKDIDKNLRDERLNEPTTIAALTADPTFVSGVGTCVSSFLLILQSYDILVTHY